MALAGETVSTKALFSFINSSISGWLEGNQDSTDSVNYIYWMFSDRFRSRDKHIDDGKILHETVYYLKSSFYQHPIDESQMLPCEASIKLIKLKLHFCASINSMCACARLVMRLYYSKCFLIASIDEPKKLNLRKFNF